MASSIHLQSLLARKTSLADRELELWNIIPLSILGVTSYGLTLQQQINELRTNNGRGRDLP